MTNSEKIFIGLMLAFVLAVSFAMLTTRRGTTTHNETAPEPDATEIVGMPVQVETRPNSSSPYRGRFATYPLAFARPLPIVSKAVH
jgi:starvation-inducible outer membrane lipoprotein